MGRSSPELMELSHMHSFTSGGMRPAESRESSPELKCLFSQLFLLEYR